MALGDIVLFRRLILPYQVLKWKPNWNFRLRSAMISLSCSNCYPKSEKTYLSWNRSTLIRSKGWKEEAKSYYLLHGKFQLISYKIDKLKGKTSISIRKMNVRNEFQITYMNRRNQWSWNFSIFSISNLLPQ